MHTPSRKQKKKKGGGDANHIRAFLSGGTCVVLEYL